MKTPYFLFAILLGLIISCGDSTPQEAVDFNQKMKETIAIHDEVMPEMGKINQLMSKLETQMDSTNVEQYKPAVENLKIAHDKMMSWMRSFGDEFSRTEINQGIQLKNVDSLKQRLKALDKSFQEAEDMQNHIQEAIKNAEDLLK